MKTHWVCLCVAGLLAAAVCGGSARAATAPTGLWSGRFQDGSGVCSLYVQGDGGWVASVNGMATSGFAWDWNPTSVGGIITLHYMHAGFHDKLYYSVTYLGDGRILLSDPYFKVILNRQ